MIVNLIKSQQIFHLILPNKIKGQYWITDKDKNDKKRELISIEAIQSEWVIKSNKHVSVLDSSGNVVSRMVIEPLHLFYLHLNETGERAIIFTESVDESWQTFKKYVVRTSATLNIGRNGDNNLCYENKYVSGTHAKLSFDGDSWFIHDMESTNGTYVNSCKVD